mmetsp:Transcript_78253/g.242612  ORF Transcript_78253/g.242612 Transcript_78253/m.242612 type:complete len:234 (-) Transcript_78253:234-935(-)
MGRGEVRLAARVGDAEAALGVVQGVGLGLLRQGGGPLRPPLLHLPELLLAVGKLAVRVRARAHDHGRAELHAGGVRRRHELVAAVGEVAMAVLLAAAGQEEGAHLGLVEFLLRHGRRMQRHPCGCDRDAVGRGARAIGTGVCAGGRRAQSWRHDVVVPAGITAVLRAAEREKRLEAQPFRGEGRRQSLAATIEAEARLGHLGGRAKGCLADGANRDWARLEAASPEQPWQGCL